MVACSARPSTVPARSATAFCSRPAQRMTKSAVTPPGPRTCTSARTLPAALIAPANPAGHLDAGDEARPGEVEVDDLVPEVRPAPAAQPDARPVEVHPPAGDGIRDRERGRSGKPPVVDRRGVPRRRVGRRRVRQRGGEAGDDAHLGDLLRAGRVCEGEVLDEARVEPGRAAVRVVERRHVEGVLDLHVGRGREARGDLLCLRRRGDRVEVAVEHERRHRRVGRAGRVGRVRAGRRGPPKAGEHALVVGARPGLGREGVEGPGRVGRQPRVGFRLPAGHRRGEVPQLRVVVADDRQVERLGGRRRVLAAHIDGDDLGREAQHRRVVAAVGRLERREEVAPEARIPVAGRCDLDERVLVQPDARPRAVAVGGEADDRAATHPDGEVGEQPERIGGRAVRAAAHDVEAEPDRLEEVGPRRIRARQRVRPVQRDRAQPARVAQGVGLRRVGAVRVPVEIDAPGAQRADDRLDVLHRLRGRVEVALRAYLLRAIPGARDVADGGDAEGPAAERAAPPRPAQVDQEEVAPQRDRPPHLDAPQPVGRDREAGASLDGHHGGEPRLGAKPARVALEVDADLRPVRTRAVERDGNEAAGRPPVELERLGRARGDDRGRRRKIRDHRSTIGR